MSARDDGIAAPTSGAGRCVAVEGFPASNSFAATVAPVAPDPGPGPVHASSSAYNGRRSRAGAGDPPPQQPPPRRRMIFFHPEDREHLSELICVVREQIEVFVEGPNNKSAPPAVPAQQAFAEGRVGIRCVHCAPPSPRPPPPPPRCGDDGGGEGSSTATAASPPPMRGSVVYPTSTRLVYQSVRNYQRHHMLNCPSMPGEVRERLVTLKGSKWHRRSSNKCGRYWENSCARLGLVDTDDGLRLRKEVLGGTWTDEMGRDAMERAVAATNAAKGTAVKATKVAKPVRGAKRLQAKVSKSSIEVNDAGSAFKDAAPGTDTSAPDGIFTEAVASQAGAAMDPSLALPSAKGARQIIGSKGMDRLLSTPGTKDGEVSGIAALPLRLGTESLQAGDTDIFTTQLSSRLEMAMSSKENPTGGDSKLFDTAQECALQLHPYEQSTRMNSNGDGSRQRDSIEQTQNSTLLTDDGWLAMSNALSSQDTSGMPSSVQLDLDLSLDPIVSNDYLQSAAQVPAPLTSKEAATMSMSEVQVGRSSHSAPLVREGLGSDSSSAAISFQEGFAAAATVHSSLVGTNGALHEPDRRDNGESGRGDGNSALDIDGLLTLQEGNWGEVEGEEDRPPESSSAPLSKESVLKRVELACSTIQAAAEIRHLPLGGDAFDSASDDGGGGSNRADPEELYDLGAELYELFADRPPSDTGDDDSILLGEGMMQAADGAYSHGEQQRMKRGRAPERAKGKTFVPLGELGFPSALCSLVSSLLEAKSNDREARDKYSSFEEVQEDMQLMVSNPKKYLFDSSGASGWAELQLLDFHQDELYGRREQLSELTKAFDQVTAPTHAGAKSGLVLISGYSGTGKSSLVRKVQRQYINRGAHFISGKFDVIRQMQPLSAVMNALNEYCDLLADNKGKIDQIRTAMMSSVGSEGQVIADLIPNLRKVLPDLDHGPPSAQVFGREVQHRLEFLIRMLLRSTCSKENPVILFLDDLQWADASSLELIRSLVTDAMLDSALFIGCYRANEVSPGHPLLQCLDDIRNFGSVSITDMSLGNLDMDSVHALVSDALHAFPRTTRSLAEVVMQKTGGNALFVEQFLTSLRDEGLLRYSLPSRRWEWNLKEIKAKNIANNVVELMTTKLLRLAPNVQSALRIAAAFGSKCEEDILRIYDKDPCNSGNTPAALDVAVTEGLMAKVEGPAYCFSHDQIQVAAYMLIHESQRELFHLQIGRSLWQQASPEEMDTHLFVVVEQVHRGAGHIIDYNEKVRLAQLSFMAGQKAASMSAFLPASVYLKSGISFLSEHDWELRRELCFDLYNLCAEVEYGLGKFDDVKIHLEELIKRGRTNQEKLRAYYTFVRSCGSQNNTAEVFATAISVLGHLGESVPSTVTKLEVQQEFRTSHMLLSAKTEGELDNLMTMTDADKKEAMRFYNLLLIYAYTSGREAFALMACRMVQLSLSYGVCRESALAFASYGLLLCSFGDSAGGYRIGKYSVSLVERFDAKESNPRVIATVYGYINSWTEPIQSTIPPLKRAIDVALSTGDNEYAMGIAHIYVGTSLHSGKTLGPLMDEMSAFAKQMIELNQNLMETMNRPLRQFTLNLLGKSANPIKLAGTEMDEESLFNLAEEKGSRHISSVVYLFRMWLEYLFGEYELALKTAEMNDGYAKYFQGRFPSMCCQVFYYGLTILALARKNGYSKWKDEISTTMAQMENWTLSSPWNCQHKLELMKAELAYLEGDFATAVRCYDCAVATADKHHFVHEKALALERAGIFYMENRQHATASSFFERACDCYGRWEAHSKAAHVKSYL